jgi:hypothetical protein
MIISYRKWLWLSVTCEVYVNQFVRRFPEALSAFKWSDCLLGLSVERLAGLEMREDIVIVEERSVFFL